MAESVVVSEQPPQRFFCHLCNIEVESVTSEFTCPLCSGGFIEALPPAAELPESNDVEMTGEPSYYDLSNRLTDQISMLMSSIGGADRSMDEDSDQSQAPVRGRRRNPDFLNFDNIMHEFLLQLTGGGGGGAGGPMFFMGNPGDYAWGREGLDTVITQMLNQMENAGPPPLDKDKIHDIPKVEIDDEQVNQKLQCSVCWEDFQKSETVRKLPCLHIYHENCIIPWLELHGTCPVCRMPVDKKATEEQTQTNALNLNNMSNSIGINLSTGQVIRALHHLRTDQPERSVNRSNRNSPSDGDGSSSSQRQTRRSLRRPSDNNPSSSTTQSSQSQDNSNLSSRRDDDGNVEYDFD